MQIWNPYCRDGGVAFPSRCPATGSGSLATGGLFTNAIIPEDHPAFNDVARNITSFWPTTTVSGRQFAGNEDGERNTFDTSRTIDYADMYTFKAEHKFTDNWSLSGMYLYNKTDEPAFDYIGPTNPRDDFFFSGATWYLERRPHVAVFNNTNILNDTTVLTTRYGWTTWLDNTIPGVFEGGPAGLGFGLQLHQRHRRVPGRPSSQRRLQGQHRLPGHREEREDAGPAVEGALCHQRGALSAGRQPHVQGRGRLPRAGHRHADPRANGRDFPFRRELLDGPRRRWRP